MQLSFEELSSAGIFATITVGAPGAQGAGVTGTQGMGVMTPKAAAVAAMTSGFDIELHIPKGITFAIGILDMILAAGVPVITQVTGKTTRELGAAPKLH